MATPNAHRASSAPGIDEDSCSKQVKCKKARDQFLTAEEGSRVLGDSMQLSKQAAGNNNTHDLRARCQLCASSCCAWPATALHFKHGNIDASGG